MLQAMLIQGDRRQLLDWPSEKAQWVQSGVLWLDLQGPTAADVEALGSEFALHPFVVRACMHPEHRARLKEYRDHFLLVLNAVGRGVSENGTSAELGRWRTLELNIIVGERFMITVHPDAVAAVGTLFQRFLRAGEGRPTLEYLLYSICDAVTTSYYSVLDRVDKHIDSAESLIFSGNTGSHVVDRLFTLKRHVLYLRRVLGPQRDALGALMRREFTVIGPESRPFFLEAYEHTLRLFDLLDTYRDLISSSLDAYLSTVSNRMNEIMKTLTIVSTIMLPLTLITGVFGMNFVKMPFIEDIWGFATVMFFMLVLGTGMAIYFKKRGWM